MGFLPGSCGTGIAWCVIYEILLAACLSAVAVGLLTLVVHFCYRVPTFRRQERTLRRLADLRESGIRIRNKRPPLALLLPPTSPDKLTAWLVDWYVAVEKWKKELYDAAEELSPIEKQRMRTIDWLSDRNHAGRIVTGRQLFLLRELSATLERLDIMLQQRFRPRNSP